MLTSLLCAAALGQAPQSAPTAETFRRRITIEVGANYLVSLPEGYAENPRKRWPLMLFLHGSGERGNDVQQVAVHGPIKEIRNGRKIPMIVIAPQCPADQWGWDVNTLVGLLDHAERTYRVDRRQIFVTGLSMGGFGTFALAMRQPNRFAAIAPICGGGNPEKAGLIAKIPMWVTHGDKDQAVPVQASQSMVDAIKAAGGNPRFDIIAGGQHDVWTDFYARDDFYAWLLEQRLP